MDWGIVFRPEVLEVFQARPL